MTGRDPVELRDRLDWQGESPFFLAVGALSDLKNPLRLADAVARLGKGTLAFVGDGPLRNRVPETVGFVAHDALGPYYERAAVVCVPSRREGYGVVAREAMGYGRPVVATRVGGLADAIADGVTGLLVEPAGIRAAVQRLLGDAALRTAMGRAARLRAERELSYDVIVGRVEDALS